MHGVGDEAEPSAPWTEAGLTFDAWWDSLPKHRKRVLWWNALPVAEGDQQP